MNVMLADVGDNDIRREVLSTENMLSRSSYEIISLIERKEMCCHTTENLQMYQHSLLFNVR